MGFYKVTLNNYGASRVCVYNSGCNFNCLGCAYKLVGRDRDSSGCLNYGDIIEKLMAIRPDRVHFLGGEPTTNSQLTDLAEFAHENLGATTKIGHSNGSGRIPDCIDEASISIKAYDDNLHKFYTGTSNVTVLENFRDAFERGITLHASTVLIPGLIETGEIAKISSFIANIDPAIPLHITGYIPVPSLPWRAPTDRELLDAVRASRSYLQSVNYNLLNSEEFSKVKVESPIFRSQRLL